MYFQRANMFRETSILLISLTFIGAYKLPTLSVAYKLPTPSVEGGLDWWQKTVVYQIYPRSFQDTDGNGIGDLKGIIARIDHFIDLGIDCIWISPVYESPQVDFGYDISNYTKIDPIFGTMEDLMSLRKAFQSKGIKVVLDFVPNHTSNQHPWFIKSVKKIDPYTDYYVWKDPKGWDDNNKPIPPNNWLSLVSGSAWHYVSERKQFYLGQFFPQQPELNYRCEYVLEEMKNVLRFYLDRGIDGFRCDAVPYLVEDDRFLDEPLINKAKGLEYNNQRHEYTMDQPETYEVMRAFRAVLDSYTAKGGPTRYLLSEAYTDIRHTVEYYGTDEKPGPQAPFNLFLIVNLNDSSNAKDYKNTIDLWLNNIPKGRWPNWQIGNHDNTRVPTRFEPAAVDQLNILVLLLPGTAITYNGEEIGMEDTNIRPDQILDKLTPSRDPERTPYQWNCSLNAGFSSNKTGTWLPVNPNYYELNLERQMKLPRSHYKVYKSLVELRSTAVIQKGDYHGCVVSKWVFSFTRSLAGKKFYIVINLNNEQEYVDLKTCYWGLPKKLKIIIASINFGCDVGSGSYINPSEFTMTSKSGVVLGE